MNCTNCGKEIIGKALMSPSTDPKKRVRCMDCAMNCVDDFEKRMKRKFCSGGTKR